MTRGLGALLEEVASRAANYADPARAVAVARRRRRRHAAGAAAVVVALALGGAWVWPRPAPGPPVEPARTHPVYPPSVSPPASAPALPTSRAVGAASFVYAACPEAGQCPAFLVMPDGRQYALQRTPHAPEPTSVAWLKPATSTYTLSPDGRYLGWAVGQGYRIRDLTGTAARDVTVGGSGDVVVAAAWSPSGRYVVLARVGAKALRSYVRVAVDGSSPEVAIPYADTSSPGRREIRGVLDDGDLLLSRGLPDESAPRSPMRVADAATLRVKRTITIDQQAADREVDESSTVGGRPVLSACGCRAAFPIWTDSLRWAKGFGRDVDGTVAPVAHSVQTGLVLVDPRNGKLLGRYNLPRPTLNEDGDAFVSMWAVKADLAEGYVALNWRTDRVDIVLINPADRQRRVATRLPPGSVVLVRSAVTAVS